MTTFLEASTIHKEDQSLMFGMGMELLRLGSQKFLSLPDFGSINHNQVGPYVTRKGLLLHTLPTH